MPPIQVVRKSLDCWVACVPRGHSQWCWTSKHQNPDDRRHERSAAEQKDQQHVPLEEVIDRNPLIACLTKETDDRAGRGWPHCRLPWKPSRASRGYRKTVQRVIFSSIGGTRRTGLGCVGDVKTWIRLVRLLMAPSRSTRWCPRTRSRRERSPERTGSQFPVYPLRTPCQRSVSSCRSSRKRTRRCRMGGIPCR